jgi:mercuric ion transport protein
MVKRQQKSRVRDARMAAPHIKESLNLALLQILSCHLDGNPDHGNHPREMRMADRNLLCAGVAGTVLAAVCCFTPALVLLFGALGLSAWLAWADLVVLPVLVASVALIAYALYAARRA